MGQMGLGGLAPLLCELNLLDCACGAGWVNEEYKSRLVYRAGLSIEQNSLLRRDTQAQKKWPCIQRSQPGTGRLARLKQS